MKLTKEQKKDIARQLAQKFAGSPGVFFTQYQGLKFVDLAQLRSKLKPAGCRYQVMKNTLVANALKEAGMGGAEPALLKGPVGIVVGEKGDPVGAAKALAAFAKDFPLLKIKAGFVEKKWLGAAQVAQLAKLGTRPEMLSALAGTLQGLLSGTAGLLQAPLSQMALLIKALHDKKSGEAPAAA
jgi:large subunit ribosomal protein L10